MLSNVIFWTLVLSLVSCSGNDYDDDEFRLIRELFYKRNYNRTVRPVYNKSKPIPVSLDLAYVSLVDLDDKSQTLKSNVWIRQVWYNELLTWDPEDYGGITQIVVDKKFVWTPDIVLQNSATEGVTGSSMDQFKTRINIFFDGKHKWFAPSILASGCSVDISYFPFDIQVCVLQFMSWTYLGNQLNLSAAGDTADLSNYQPSSQFDLLSAKALTKTTYYSCCPEPYIEVIYELVLRRQPGYYVFNVIVPALVVTFFALINFAFPDQTGSKMGLCFDCFLAISVTAMMVMDMIPVNSDNVPLIAIFMIACMVQLVAAVACSAFIMAMRDGKVVPDWTKFVFITILGPLLGVNCAIKCKQDNHQYRTERILETRMPQTLNGVFQTARNSRRKKPRNGDEIEDLHELISMTPFSNKSSQSSGYPRSSVSSHSGDEDIHQSNFVFSSGFASFSDGDSDTTPLIPSPPRKEDLKALEDVNDMVRVALNAAKDEYVHDFWRCVSQIVDRTFFICFIISWVVIVTYLLMLPPKVRS